MIKVNAIDSMAWGVDHFQFKAAEVQGFSFNRSALEAGFEIERFDVYLGPSYVLFWVLTDSFSLLFGPMRGAARYVFRWLFCPILILDVIFLRVPGILNVAAGIWVILRKPQTGSGRP